MLNGTQISGTLRENLHRQLDKCKILSLESKFMKAHKMCAFFIERYGIVL